MSSEPRYIAFCGTRGLPANYGGFETAVDEITARFVKQGIPCEVFCRESSSKVQPTQDRGRSLRYVKGSKRKALDTFVSAVQTGLVLWKERHRYSHVFWFNNANFPGILMTRLAGIPMSVNTDGLEWRRAKWSWPFKLYYIFSSFLISLLCRRLISDSVAIQTYYRTHFMAKSSMIPYGAPPSHEIGGSELTAILNRYGLRKGRYFLQITRFEPDNLPFETLSAFHASGLAMDGYQMIVVGFKDQTPYAMKIKALDGRPGIVVANAIYDPTVLATLRANCCCYVHGNSVGGTNPALLEAMTACPKILAIDSVFSREVLGPLGLYFDPDDISLSLLASFDVQPKHEALVERVRSLYQWDAVADAYRRLANGEEAAYQPSPLTRATVFRYGKESPAKSAFDSENAQQPQAARTASAKSL